jgi:glucose dehydrogenase
VVAEIIMRLENDTAANPLRSTRPLLGRALLLLLWICAGLSQFPPTRSGARTAQAAPILSADWPHFGNTRDQTRFTPLAQITAGTVQHLGVAWTLSEGPDAGQWETDPVVVAGIMYLTTNTDQVLAVHAATGRVIWRFTPRVNFVQFLMAGGTVEPTNRGVEVAHGTVYLLTFDDRLIALDARTGRPRWSTTVANPSLGYTETSLPTYWHGLLFLGSSAGDSGVRGFVAAYSATTGRQVWRFYTVPAPGQGWVPATGAHGGGAVWMPPTIDPTSGMLFFGTGNPSPDFDALLRPGCNPWTDAIVALDARTGRLRWAHTLICPDAWDYDADQTPMLLTLVRQGKPLRVVGVGDKAGYYRLFDAATGALVLLSPRSHGRACLVLFLPPGGCMSAPADLAASNIRHQPIARTHS